MGMARTAAAKTSTTDKKRPARSAKRETTPKSTARDDHGDGTEELATAIGELAVAGAMEDVAAAELAAGVADLTRAGDAGAGGLSRVPRRAGQRDGGQRRAALDQHPSARRGDGGDRDRSR